MATALKLYFFIYKAKTNSKGLAPIMFRLRYNDQTSQLATGYFIKPKDWVNDKSQVKNTCSNAIIINNHLRDLELKSSNIFSKMFHEGDVYLGNIIDKLKGKEEGPISLLRLVAIFNNRLHTRIGVDLKIATYKKYQITEQKIKEYLKTLGKNDIRLKELKLGFMEDFNTFMKQHYGNCQNTTGKHLKNLKSYLKYAETNDWVHKSPFNEYKVKYRPKEKPFLNSDELFQIEEIHIENRGLALVKNLFLLQCYTGLSFSDLACLKKSDISIGIDGGLWIIKNRLKTDVRSAIPLLPKAVALIDLYKVNEYSENEKPLLPIYSIQKYNAYLKVIADLTGINKQLSSHAGRRTFASTVTLGNGISIESISQMLGHTNTKITQQYARVSDLKISNEMKLIKSKNLF
jgi:site-specific recombinase XerD